MAIASALAQIGVGAVFAQSTELYDSYFFSSNNQVLKTKGAATITGSAGTVIEDTGNNFRLVRGSALIKTANSPVSIDCGNGVSVVPTQSLSSVQLEEEPLNNSGVTANNLNSSSQSKPLMIIGDCYGLQSVGRNNEVSLAEGKDFFFPDRDLTIQTPLGSIHSKAGSRFLVKCTPGEVRILCCSGNGLTFHHANKYRRIRPSQEFAVFDHRPAQFEVLPRDGIGRKEVTMHDIDGNSMTATSNSFSVVSLLISPMYLGAWQRKSAFDKRATKGILKTAAAHAAVSPSFDDFYRAPRFNEKAIAPNAGLRN
ncbi:MAG: hypothetical protein IPG59_23145 [Candidatus Melainabacteria bacterium]|nr:MAG: hypothetical protein IPG59_23145 [Candidatus Melainabacteria bacterium]